MTKERGSSRGILSGRIGVLLVSRRFLFSGGRSRCLSIRGRGRRERQFISQVFPKIVVGDVHQREALLFQGYILFGLHLEVKAWRL